MDKKKATQRLWLLLACAWFVMAAFAVPVSAATATVSYKVTGEIDYRKSYECLKYINKLRAKKGLKPLIMDKQLLKYAELRGAELTAAYTHTRPNGKQPSSLNPKLVNGENIAYGQESASAVFNTWKNSPPHYANMTRKNFRSAGIVCFEYDGMYHWVNLFSNQPGKAVKKSGTAKVTRTVAVSKKYLKKKKISNQTGNLYIGWNRPLKIGFTGVKGQRAYGILGSSLFGFKSSDPRILTITKKGVLKPHREGKVKVAIWLKANKSVKATFTFNVGDEYDAYDDPDYSDD